MCVCVCVCMCVCVCVFHLSHEYGRLSVLFCGGCSRCVVANVMGCNSKQVRIQTVYYIPFRTKTLGESMSLLIFPLIGYIVALLFFYKNGFALNNS